MVRLNTRVETIHELLEKLLDDDSDMKDINLTAKQLVSAHDPSGLAQSQPRRVMAQSLLCQTCVHLLAKAYVCMHNQQHRLPIKAQRLCSLDLSGSSSAQRH